jgi:hypothetical protein
MQLLREPRKIEILGKSKIAHFQAQVAYYRRFMIRSSGRTAQPSEDFCHLHEQQGCIGAHNISRHSDCSQQD